MQMSLRIQLSCQYIYAGETTLMAGCILIIDRLSYFGVTFHLTTQNPKMLDLMLKSLSSYSRTPEVVGRFLLYHLADSVNT